MKWRRKYDRRREENRAAEDGGELILSY